MISKLATALATWFGCGFARWAPGTVGSLGALVPACLLAHYCGWRPAQFAYLAAALIWPAVWAADVVTSATGSEDPAFIVVDEVIGQWVALAGATRLNWKSLLAAFLLFRALDVWKPPPVRQLEKLPGGAGIVADDLMAGAYTALVLFIAGWFNLY